LIYLILFISECLTKLAPVAGKPSPGHGEAGKLLSTLAVDNFALPGDPGFPLNALYHAPASRPDAGESLILTHPYSKLLVLP
jgi:actin related protein 2/3 complex subunit 3